MGDIKKHRKKYRTPSHPYNKERLEKEKDYSKKYGLKNKKEIYKFESMLSKIKSNTKRLLRSQGGQRDKEYDELINRLKNLGLLDHDDADTVLSLETKDLLERRLQSIVYKKGLANSMNQARQYIIHEHISVGDKKISSPSYLVTLQEEPQVSFSHTSMLSKEDHPQRVLLSKELKKEIEKTKLTTKKDEKRLLDEDIVPEEDSKEVLEEVEIKIEDAEVVDAEEASEEELEKAVEESEDSKEEPKEVVEEKKEEK